MAVTDIRQSRHLDTARGLRHLAARLEWAPRR
jgi:hypothetical protein